MQNNQTNRQLYGHYTSYPALVNIASSLEAKHLMWLSFKAYKTYMPLLITTTFAIRFREKRRLYSSHH